MSCKFYKLFFYLSFISFSVTNCLKEKENPNRILNKLYYEGALKKKGNFPKPTFHKPLLSNLSAFSGGLSDVSFSIKFKAECSFQGIYLKVKGADFYLDIPFKYRYLSENEGFGVVFVKNDFDEFILIMEVLGNSFPQNFDIEYCFYYGKNLVSNIEKVNVSIKDFKDYSKLLGKWKTFKTVSTNNRRIFHKNDEWNSLDTARRYKDTSFVFRKQYFVDFDKNGIFTESKKRIFVSGKIPSTFPKNEKELSIINHGKWTYNPETKDLIIVYLENNNWLRYLGDELFEGKIIKLDESDLELKIRKSFYGREETNYFKRF